MSTNTYKVLTKIFATLYMIVKNKRTNKYKMTTERYLDLSKRFSFLLESEPEPRISQPWLEKVLREVPDGRQPISRDPRDV